MESNVPTGTPANVSDAWQKLKDAGDPLKGKKENEQSSSQAKKGDIQDFQWSDWKKKLPVYTK